MGALVTLRLFAPQLLALYALAASALVVHLRGRTRLGFFRQLTDHSTLLAPYNVLMYLFSAVPNRAYIPTSKFPELAKLRDNWQTIRAEAIELYGDGHIKTADKYNDMGFNSFFRTGWKRFYLKWYDDPLPSAQRLCPKTVELLSTIPNVKGAMFATLAPGSHLVTHRDPFAGSLRYHLGLVTPTSPGECRIFVDGQAYTWRDGEDVIFDETFVHTAENTTDQTRIILFADVERPLYTPFMRALNRWVCRRIIKESATENSAGDRVGVFNRAFGQIYKVRLLGKRMKAWNRQVYYAVKYSLIGLLLAGIVVSAL
jgi:beta-hydroxylase